MADFTSLSYNRKYRPDSVNGYIGNAKLKETAMKALERERRPQVIMFVGDSGCGKTTFARIYGKEYSCLNRHPKLGACNTCANCQAINEYIATGKTDYLTNIKEVNIAEQSGKNDLVGVLEDMQLPSFGDEWKIYIFDECHKATEGQQNLLLKYIEEPPENVLMMFCTTNPEKMLPTFLNRMELTLHVQKPTVKELAGLLRHVCESEQVDYDQKGLEFIANRGSLTIRTALMNLQQVVTEQNSAKYENAIQVFEEVSQTLIVDFFKALKRKDTLRFVTLLHQIKSKMELSVFLAEVRDFVKRGIYTINGLQMDGVSDGELKVYRDLFGDLSIEEICGFLTKLLTLDSRNLELELMMWGYGGLVSKPNASGAESDLIVPMEKELVKEVAMTNKILQETEVLTAEQGVKNAEAMMETATIETLLSMGAIMVNE